MSRMITRTCSHVLGNAFLTETYDKVTQLDIMLDGADGLLSTCKRIRDAGLSSNSMRNAKRTMEHVTKMVCDKL